MSDLDAVPGVTSAVLRREANGELVFTVGRAVEVIEACISAGIAVLGIEDFPGLNVLTYHSHLKNPANEKHWPGYVRTNNALAEDFIRKNPAPSTSECILGTASGREFCEIIRQSNQ
jgi:hypothetical protein